MEAILRSVTRNKGATVGGILLVIIGLVGGLIPILQGWMFGIPGLIILSNYFPPAKRLLGWAKAKAKFNQGS